jgi:Stage II sporulation protein
VGFVRGVGPWAALLLVLALGVAVVRKACRSGLSGPGYRQRVLDYRPRSFDPRLVPSHILVLRKGSDYRMAVCAADYRGKCVQRIGLEKYVAGVVAAEEGTFGKRAWVNGRLDPKRRARIQEAWKLQAIAARTYAIYAAVADKYYVASSGFHLTDTPRDQAYRARPPPEIQRAVRATAGQVLVDRRRRLVYAEYSACCRSKGTRDVVQRRQHIPCHRRCKDFAFAGSSHFRGMCQWGSYLFASEGRRLAWLLRHYYPNAHILKLP